MSTTRDAAIRFSGMYGSAFRDGVKLGEVTQVTAEVQVNRITVPLVGQTREGHKAGREQRDGNLTIQKISADWELDFYEFIKNRNDPTVPAAQRRLKQFTLKIQYDDPDSLGGVEAWQLYGCSIWSLPLGFNIQDDSVERSFPFTWESEEPMQAFRLNKDLVPTPYTG